MAILLAQSIGTGTLTFPYTIPVSLAYGSNNTAGNLLVLLVWNSSNGTATLPTDSQGNTWVFGGSAGLSGVGMYYAANCKVGANTVTPPALWTTLNSSGAGGYAIHEFSGVKTTSPLDQFLAVVISGGVAPTITPSLPQDLILVWNFGNSIWTVGAPYSQAVATESQYPSLLNGFVTSGWFQQGAAAPITANTGWSGGGTYNYALIASFFAPATYPVVTTQAASSTTTTTATANGTITNLGNEPNCTQQGFVYGTSNAGVPANGTVPGSSGWASNVNAAGTFGLGSFTGSLTGLTPSTTYFYCAFAANAIGYSYGAVTSFFTSVVTQTSAGRGMPPFFMGSRSG